MKNKDELISLLRQTNCNINKLINNLEATDKEHHATEEIVNYVLDKKNIDADKLKKICPFFYDVLIDYANAYRVDERKENEDDKLGWHRLAKVNVFINSIIKSGGNSLDVFAKTGKKVEIEDDEIRPLNIHN